MGSRHKRPSVERELKGTGVLEAFCRKVANGGVIALRGEGRGTREFQPLSGHNLGKSEF